MPSHMAHATATAASQRATSRRRPSGRAATAPAGLKRWGSVSVLCYQCRPPAACCCMLTCLLVAYDQGPRVPLQIFSSGSSGPAPTVDCQSAPLMSNVSAAGWSHWICAICCLSAISCMSMTTSAFHPLVVALVYASCARLACRNHASEQLLHWVMAGWEASSLSQHQQGLHQPQLQPLLAAWSQPQQHQTAPQFSGISPLCPPHLRQQQQQLQQQIQSPQPASLLQAQQSSSVVWPVQPQQQAPPTHVAMPPCGSAVSLLA
jgi:hypothetical protein